ncbi:MAG: branched chain amino acid ABC transporter substrate-binding protein [Candidatus Tectimicrobiota bacterium]|nr:MAG: branched chain amino acid ABC transporter substrate-binding protein [Candidatus Tectomicrobia bacterium]
MQTWRIRLTGILLLLALGPTVQAAQGEVVIGLLTPLTGTNAVQGTDIQRGVALAVERINAGYAVPLKGNLRLPFGPGVLGKPLRVLVEDTESRPASAMDAVRKLVNVDKVPLVLGEYASGISLPTGQFTNAQGVVQIAIASTSPALRDIGPFFFDVMGLDDVAGRALARFAVKDSGARRFTSIVPNNPFGVGIELHACKTLEEEFGGQCVAKVRYELEKPDYRAELQAAFQGNPEAGFYTAYGTEARLLFKQAYELGLKPPKGWYADYLTMWSNEVAQTPEIAEGVKGFEVGVSGDFYEAEYAQAYRAKYGEAPLTSFGAYAYDATWLAALAIQLAGKPDPQAIRAALHVVDDAYLGVTGDKTFDADGMQVTETYQWFIYTGGKLKPYPYPGE